MFSRIKKPGITANIDGITQPNHPVIFHRGLFRLELYHGISYHQNVISKQLKRVGFKPLKIYPEGNSFMHPATPWTPGFAFIAEHIWVDNIGESNAIIEFEPDTGKLSHIVFYRDLKRWTPREERRMDCIDGDTRDDATRFVFGDQSGWFWTLRGQLERSIGIRFNAVEASEGSDFKYVNAYIGDIKTLQVRPSPAALYGAKNSPTSLYMRTEMERKFSTEKLKDYETYELVCGVELRYIND